MLLKSRKLGLLTVMIGVLTGCSGSGEGGNGASSSSIPTPVSVDKAGKLVTTQSQISSNSDDAEENASGVVRLDSSDLEFVQDGANNQLVGMRFSHLEIPQGVTITNAYLEFEVDEVGMGSIDLTVTAQATANAGTFTNTANNISNRARTVANVTWNDEADWAIIGTSQQSPDISRVIQEIVDQSSWANGNAIAIIVSGSSNGKRVAISYDSSISGAPKLIVEYRETVGEQPDHLPTGNPDAVTTAVDTAVSVNVLLNDTGLEDGGLQVEIVSGPSNGLASVVNNEIVYLPSTAYVGSDSLSYKVTDADGDSSMATNLSIVVALPVNNLPTAQPDAVTTTVDTTVSMNVLQNDSGLEDGGLRVEIVSGPSSGSASVVNNQIEYTPSAAYVGSDSLSYRVTDADGDSSVAILSVLVVAAPVNYLPIAQPDFAATAVDTAVSVNVLLNDSGLEDGGLRVEIVSGPSNGSASVVSNQIEYTPSAAYIGSDSMAYKVTDDDGDSSLASLSVVVGKTVTISWSANTEQDVIGYYIYHGPVSGDYAGRIWVGNSTEYVYASAIEGPHYFVATAVDIYDNESVYSAEVTSQL